MFLLVMSERLSVARETEDGCWTLRLSHSRRFEFCRGPIGERDPAPKRRKKYSETIFRAFYISADPTELVDIFLLHRGLSDC